MKFLVNLLSATFVLTFLAAPGLARGQEQRIHGMTPKPVADGSAKLTRRMSPFQMLRLTLTLQPVQQAELDKFIRDVQDVHSPRFHHFMTFNEWKKNYAPSDASVALVRGWAQHNGLNVVHEFRNNLAIKVEGDVATIERTFDVQMNHYTTETRVFYSNDRDPAFPTELAGVLKHVHGLSSYHHVHSMSQGFDAAVADAEPIYVPGEFISQHVAQGHGMGARNLVHKVAALAPDTTGTVRPDFMPDPGSGLKYEAPDLFSSEAYDLNGLSKFSSCCNPNHNPGGTPKETSIAIIGVNSMSDADLTAFVNQYGMAFNVTHRTFSGATCCDQEMTLDVEWSTAFSNSLGSYLDTAHVYVYEGASSFIVDALDAWELAQSDDNARNASSSQGAPESVFASANMISDFTDVIDAMAATGWSIAIPTGDHGATDDCSTLSVSFPAADPNVVAAGGAFLGLEDVSGSAKFSNLNAWNGPGCNGASGLATNNGGGGGGCSSIEPRGFYQELFGSGLCTGDPANPKRSLPDVALNSEIGQATYFNGAWSQGSGTSVVAPELAGYFAQVNSYLLMLGNICGNSPPYQACSPLGSPNYWLWLLGLSGSGNGRRPFYDIKGSSPFKASLDCIGGDKDLNGNPQGLAAPYCATDGYDQATGWGAFNMLQLTWGIAHELGNGPVPDVQITGPTENTWYNTDQKVNFTVESPVIAGTSASFGVAGYTAQWDKNVDDTANPGIPGSGNSFYDGPANTGSSSFLSLAAAGLGCHNAHVRGWDRAGVATDDDTYGPVCFDNQMPSISGCSPLNDPTWHPTDVTVTCTAADQANGSGLANPADAGFAVSTSVPTGTETASAATGSHTLCDVAGNCAQGGPFSPYKVDKKPPVITVTSPTNTQYIVKQPVAANYGCVDGGSGVATCAGTVANGANIDTSSVGTKAFTVNSTDNVGNASRSSLKYDVTYRICLLYDPNNPIAGRAATIKVQICDYNGANLSASNIVLHATAVDGDLAKLLALGSLNQGNNFLFGPPSAPGASYLYLLDTLRLGSGQHVINFMVLGDPDPHTALFTLR